MSVELVTGYSGVGGDGEPNRHVSSAEDGARQAGTVGLGSYVLSTGSKLSATMEDANTLVVADGDVVMNGRHVSLPDPTSFTIPTGVQGQKVSNLAVLRYQVGSDSVESVTPVVITGEPSAEAPTDPAYNEGSILDGDSPVDFPLYRVVTDGINAEDPVALFDVLMPMADLRESLSQKLLWQGTYTGGQTIEVPGIGDYDVLSFAMSIGFTTFPVVCTRLDPGSGTFTGCTPFFSSGQVIYLLYVSVTVQGDELSSTAANVSYMRLNPNDWTHGVTTGATITKIVGIF